MTADVPGEAETPRVDLPAATVRAWRLSIEASTEAGGVPLGAFNWPWALGLALDAIEQRDARIAAAIELLDIEGAELRQVRDENERLRAENAMLLAPERYVETAARLAAQTLMSPNMAMNELLRAAGLFDRLAAAEAEVSRYKSELDLLSRTSADEKQIATDEIERLGAQVSRLRAAVERLVSCLEWTEINFRTAVSGKPVRDMAENLAANESALAAALSVGDTNPESAKPELPTIPEGSRDHFTSGDPTCDSTIAADSAASGTTGEDR